MARASTIVLISLPAPDVVDLAGCPKPQHRVDAGAVIRDVDVVAQRPAVAIDRQRLIVERVGHEDRDDLLGVLVRPDVVRAARDHDRQVVCRAIRQHHQVAAGFAGGVRAAWRERVRLLRLAGRHVAVDLVGADLEEPPELRPSRRFEQHPGAPDVGLDEGTGVEDRAVDVRLGGEVDDGVGLRDERLDDVGVGDVALHEREARTVAEVGDVARVARVGQLVEDGDSVVRIPRPARTARSCCR